MPRAPCSAALLLLLLGVLADARLLLGRFDGLGGEALAEAYLTSIRGSTAALREFVAAMPKGADLHVHLTGAAWAEDAAEGAADAGAWLCPSTLVVAAPPASAADNATCPAGWQPLAAALAAPNGSDMLQALVRSWSMEDYSGSDPYWYFFGLFDVFSYAMSLQRPRLVKLLAQQARRENVQFLELMGIGLAGPQLDPANQSAWDALLLEAQERRDGEEAQELLGQLHAELTASPDWDDTVQALASKNDALLAELTDSDVLVRLQGYIVRTTGSPASVFAAAAAGAEAVPASVALVGMNLVAPEADPLALRDYWIHMQIFKFIREQYPDVPFALHAGELQQGLVPPADLEWHIGEAVRVARPRRIGHGVDLPFERDAMGTLQEMKRQGIVLEVLLSSNEALLGVEGTASALGMYRAANVTYVVGSDDPGILRGSLSGEFVKLFQDYNLTYGEAKRAAFNSIRHSFIQEAEVKRDLEAALARGFADFEAAMPQRVALLGGSDAALGALLAGGGQT